jgi:hypothetical protein
MKRQFLALIVFLAIVGVLHAQDNQIVNAGFETPNEAWNYFGGKETTISKSGKYGLVVTQKTPSWAGAEQVLRLPKGVSTVEVKGWMKSENVVQNSQDYEKARIAIEFLDENNQVTGGYPPAVGYAVGTTNWNLYENQYDVPEGAVKIKVQLALANCIGTVYYDDIELYLKGTKNEFLKSAKATGPSDWGAWYSIPLETSQSGSHYVDWSSLLDAPAGKHGFAHGKDDQIIFDDGTLARFWGTNLVAGSCFLEKAEADSFALRLSKMGCNLLRLHHMDAPWSIPNIFGNAENTRRLSGKQLDKVDYLIAVLKKRGIYVFLDLLVHREFKESDGVMNKPPDLGGKQVAYFDDKLIELQKEYIEQLLTHKNPYTGLAYKDEPAIVGSEFINESSAFLHFDGDILTPAYKALLLEKFNADPKNDGKILSAFDLDYSSHLSPTLRQRTGNQGDSKESIKFFSQIEQRYYRTMHDFMRKLGVKYLLSGSNFPNPILAYQWDNSQLELMLTNDYWDHPQVWKINNEWDEIEHAPFNNTAILKNYTIGSIHNITKYKWKDKPLIVTEYNVCYPNEYRLEGVPYLAAYGRLQGLNGMLQFNMNPEPTGLKRDLVFAINNMPEHLANWVVAAPLFLKGYVKEAPSTVADKVTMKQIMSLPSYSDFIDQNTYLPLVTKVRKEVVDSIQKVDLESFKKFNNKKNGVIQSETKELALNTLQGIMKINTPKVQGVVGALKDSTFDFPSLKINLKNPWASAIAVSKDDKPLLESKHFYLVITTPVRTKNMQYDASRNTLKEIGDYVLQAQYAMGNIIFKTNGKVKVYPLSLSGKKGKEAITEGNKLNLYNQNSFVFEVMVE